MAAFGGGNARYTNPLNKLVRSGAQKGLLKTAVWGLCDVSVHGLEHLTRVPDSSAFIVVGNHSSHFDAPLILGALPNKISSRLSTGAAADYFFKKWYTALPTELFFNAFPVDRKGTRGHRGKSSELLEQGVPILLFPEGTRSRTGGMGPFKPGAAALAISHNIPVLPIALVGAYAAWPSGDSRWRPGRPPVHVVLGAPMMPSPGEIAHQFSERLRREVISLHDTTARAYGMPLQADMMRNAAIEKARAKEQPEQTRQAGRPQDDPETAG